jgi:CBS domain-containing protein
MFVREMMSTDVETISAEATLREAAAQMKSRDIGLLPVLDNDRVVGVITDRDIVLRAVAKGRNPSESTVRAAMSPNVISCRADEEIGTAAAIMGREQIRRVIVLDATDHPVGILALGDLATRLRNEELCGGVLERISESAAVATA